MTDTPLPAAPEAEKQVIGSVLLVPECGPADVFPRLRLADFIDAAHQHIYGAMIALHQSGAPIESTLLCQRLKDSGHYDAAGGAAYLLELGQSVATAAHVGFYVEQVVEAARKRRLVEIAESVREGAMNGRPAGEVFNNLWSDCEDWRREHSDARAGRYTLAELRREFPALKPPVVDGLYRQGETVNVISHSKVGKSWLVYSLALAEITRRPWLDRFNTSGGRVLLIDNELHGATLAHRIPEVANAMAIPAEHYQNDLTVWTLRGKLRGLADLAADLSTVEPGQFSTIILDSKYRFARAGVSENDNTAETLFYNLIDEIAERTGAAIVLVHHTSKGGQADKRVTDVGAGAGAQSRAADCHLILREHEQPDVVTLEAAVRSFAPVEPMALRWCFPLWLPADDVDPGRLKRQPTQSEQRQRDRDKEGLDATVKALLDGPATVSVLRQRTGYRKERQENLLNLLHSQGHVTYEVVTRRGNQCHEYRLSE